MRADRLSEEDALRRLRLRFEADGYTFIAKPQGNDLPEFLRTSRPDAVAISPNDNIVIEVQAGRNKASDAILKDLAAEVSSHAGWRLLVIYIGEEPDSDASWGGMEPLSRAESGQIALAVDDVRALKHRGGNRYALVSAWSVLEAVMRRIYDDNGLHSRPLSPVEMVERLAMDGFVDVDEARRLRGLISARNRSAHGDLSVDVPDTDVDFMLDKAEEINAAALA